MELICPKCRGTMRQYERSGITVDQCSECRGIFLDRGEMERLVDAEAAFHTAARAVPPAYGSPPGDPSRDERYRDDRYKDDRYKDDRYRDRDKDDRYKDDRYKDDRYRDDRYKDDRYKDDRYRPSSGYHDPRKKKRSFLEDLFD